jgi:murein DD-endopeptidase MepM/ murein hydrolase activator NlpD
LLYFGKAKALPYIGPEIMDKNRINLFELFLNLSLVLLIFSIYACARHRIPAEKPTRIPEKRIERKGVYHLVERHQTLYRICKTYGVDLNEVASINGIADKSKIQEGQRFFIPGVERVLRVEIYIDDVVKESVEKERETSSKIDFVWPVEGKCLSFFEEEERKRHQGIDISSPSGTPIKAAGSGRVIYSGNSIRGYGNLIILRHSEEFVTVYAHNQVNLVEEGMRVEKGKIIAKVGQTGRASGPHLHFEIRRNNQAIDPFLVLK